MASRPWGVPSLKLILGLPSVAKLIASAFSVSSAVKIFVLITAESAEEEGDKEKRTAQVFFSTD
jgi:hypothetical protein